MQSRQACLCGRVCRFRLLERLFHSGSLRGQRSLPLQFQPVRFLFFCSHKVVLLHLHNLCVLDVGHCLAGFDLLSLYDAYLADNSADERGDIGLVLRIQLQFPVSTDYAAEFLFLHFA